MFTRPSLLIRLEAAAILLVTVVAYHDLQASWLLFAVLFLTPDLFILGYLANPRLGSALYNLAHTLWLPLLLALYAWDTERTRVLAIALIWLAHIAFDRIMGYGLKYPTHFKDTHLQHLD